MREIGEVRKRLKGEEAEEYMPFARLMLGQLKERMKMLNLQQLQWQKILAGGVIVFVSSVFGQDTIEIVRPQPIPVENPPVIPNKELIFTKEIYTEEDEFYYFAGTTISRDFLFEVTTPNANTTFIPLNDLYKYKDGELEFVQHYDFGKVHAQGIAVSDDLIMISYTDEFIDAAHVNFYSKLAPDVLLKSYSYPLQQGSTGGAGFVWGGFPVFHKDEFKIVITNGFDRYFYIYDKSGNYTEQRYLIDPTYDYFSDLFSMSLSVNPKDELVIMGENFFAPVYTFWHVAFNDAYSIVSTKDVVAGNSDSTTSDITDYGGFFNPHPSSFVFAEGRFSYGSKSKIALVSTYGTVRTQSNEEVKYTEEQKERYRVQEWIYWTITQTKPLPELMEAFLKGKDAETLIFLSDPFYELVEFNNDGSILKTIPVPAGQFYASTAAAKTKKRTIYTYKTENDVETLIGIDVYQVKDGVDIFLYKEL